MYVVISSTVRQVEQYAKTALFNSVNLTLFFDAIGLITFAKVVTLASEVATLRSRVVTLECEVVILAPEVVILEPEVVILALEVVILEPEVVIITFEVVIFELAPFR